MAGLPAGIGGILQQRRGPCLWINLIIFCRTLFGYSYAQETGSFAILMPHVKPTQPDVYLCTAFVVDSSKDYYIVGYSPNASMNIAHHMLMYGCELPGVPDEAWECGGSDVKTEYRAGGVCSTKSQILYAWARDAPPLKLPDGVGFKVGGKTNMQYIVLQVHYSDVSSFVEGKTDDSGVVVHYTEAPQPKTAGIFLVVPNGEIPPNSTTHLEAACEYRNPEAIHPFAYRTHTHTLGRVVSGYLVQRTDSGVDQWTLIGKKNPLLPQMFYPVENTVTVSKGDILAARCTMVSNRTTITYPGATHLDEMCNFYIMYWTDSPTPLKQDSCSSAGPPYYYWRTGRPLLNNIPHVDASTFDSISYLK